MEPHVCVRLHPDFMKGKQLKREVRNEIKESGISGSKCIKLLNKKVKEKEENEDHDGVMFNIGRTETIKRQLIFNFFFQS